MTIMADLKTLQQRWGLALQSASFGVWDLSVPEQRVHYSPEWKAMLGYPADDDADSTELWRERVHPDDLATMLAELSAHLAGRTANYECEFRLRAAGGNYRWVLSRGSVVARDGGGAALRVVGTLTDLTRHHQAERLHLERDRAEAARSAKTEFLGRMSHELRTPLNAVLGFAQLLAQQLAATGSEEQRRYVQQIEGAGWNLVQMIDDVLDLSALETGRLQVRLEPVALAPLVHLVHAQVQALAAPHGVRIVVDPVPEAASVHADTGRLEQVLINLSSNAIKYNRRGGSVKIAAAMASPTHWRLSVSDTGIGIPAAQLPHLFEPFNRLGRADGAGPASTAVFAGTGLALSRSLMTAMGGQLMVRSTEGIGSAFEISLPAARAAPGTDALPITV